MTYDSVYGQLPVSETATVSTSGVTTLSTTVPMTGTPGWDRGTGGVRRVVDPNGFETTVTYDGFGRLTSMTPPAVGACASHPATVITYDITTDGLARPASRVLTTSYLGAHDAPTSLCAADGDVIETVGFMDGLGRPRASLATADYTGQWIRSGVSVLNKKGEVRYGFQPVYHWGSTTDFAAALAVPPTTVEGNRIYTATTYDAFGRAVGVQDESGNNTTTNFHAASQDVCDPNDNDGGSPFANTCTTVRVDGHGREIDQILRQRTGAGDEQHRLWTYYRDDGAVLALVRARSEAGIRPAYSSIAGSSDPHVVRVFTYDNQGRRLSSNDPDTDARGVPTARRSWRYAFNRIGDLVAVRDPRGCGQNFFYDLGGRLLGEQYVSCEEGYTSRPEQPNEVVPSGSYGMSMLGASATVDVRYSYDAFPSWVPSGTLPGGSYVHLGRATGVADRGQRSAVLYDRRGQAVWTARQMALLGEPIPMPTDTSAPTPSGVVSYDDTHTYVRTSAYDQGGRVRTIGLPRDPDYDASESGSARLGPTMGAEMRFDHRGLPARATAVLGTTSFDVVSNITYDRDGAVLTVEYGGEGELTTTTWYDERRRPTRSQTHRERQSGTTAGTLEHVETITDQILGWDPASNLTQLVDARDVAEWPSGHRPRTLQMSHDALYHVTGATAWYLDPDDTGIDAAGDWRTEAAATNAADPMHIDPAPMVSALPEERVNALTWSYDYLGNSTFWNDDATNFYERSLGAITNGNDLNGDHTDASSSARPSALYLASNLEMSTPGALPEGRGYVEVDYGVSGNVASMTVYGECSHVTGTSCSDNTALSLEARRDWLAENCSCERAQHYQYLYDELNRMAEARRFDRATPTGSFDIEVRQRYRYDSANQRTVKATYDVDTDDERIALYVYPGDFERRGLTRGLTTYDADTSGADTTETQYVLAGGRVVFDEGADLTGTLNRNDRITVGVTDLIQTTGAVVDLVSGELIEVSTYYPNGARENLWTSSANIPLEPNGFTGKEADEEVGLTYFGERYLISRIGRWATPDPLHIHANGGGEALNSYHYVSGNLLQARDPLGLSWDTFVRGVGRGGVAGFLGGAAVGFGLAAVVAVSTPIVGAAVVVAAGAAGAMALGHSLAENADAIARTVAGRGSDQDHEAVGELAGSVVGGAIGAGTGGAAAAVVGDAAASALPSLAFAGGRTGSGAVAAAQVPLGGTASALLGSGAAAHIVQSSRDRGSRSESAPRATAETRGGTPQARRATPSAESPATAPASGAAAAEGAARTPSSGPVRNAHLAGQTHPRTGVPFDADGFPDFSAWGHPEVPDVRIELSGSRSTDFARANAAAGLPETPAGYTWHHNQDRGLMQLIETEVHRRTGHTGGFSR